MSLSREARADPSDTSPVEDDTNFHCMVFVYNKTEKNGNDSVTFVKTNYTCDTANNCLGRTEPFEVSWLSRTRIL